MPGCKLVSVFVISLWCLASAWSAPNLQAQDAAGALYGSVVNVVGQPLANVRITLVGIRCNTVTDAAGAFELLAVPTGTYIVRAELTGYVSSDMPGVRISADQIVRAEFRLAPPRVIPAEVDATCPHPVVPHSHILAVATPSPLPAQVFGSPHRETTHGCEAHPLAHSPLGLASRALVSWVGIYGMGEFDVEVGASRFGCEGGARAALQHAVQNQPTQDAFRAGGTEVHVVTGATARTYVFAANELIWWITGPDDLARTVLAGLLNAPELVRARSPM